MCCSFLYFKSSLIPLFVHSIIYKYSSNLGHEITDVCDVASTEIIPIVLSAHWFLCPVTSSTNTDSHVARYRTYSSPAIGPESPTLSVSTIASENRFILFLLYLPSNSCWLFVLSSWNVCFLFTFLFYCDVCVASNSFLYEIKVYTFNFLSRNELRVPCTSTQTG